MIIIIIIITTTSCFVFTSRAMTSYRFALRPVARSRSSRMLRHVARFRLLRDIAPHMFVYTQGLYLCASFTCIKLGYVCAIMPSLARNHACSATSACVRQVRDAKFRGPRSNLSVPCHLRADIRFKARSPRNRVGASARSFEVEADCTNAAGTSAALRG